MKNYDLKDILNRLQIPEPDQEARNKAIQSAVAEFRRQAIERETEVKGFSWLGRLMGKLIKGGPIMQRPIAITATLAAGCIALTIALTTIIDSGRSPFVKSDGIQVAAHRDDGQTSVKPADPEPLEQKMGDMEQLLQENARMITKGARDSTVADESGVPTPAIALPSSSHQEEFALEDATSDPLPSPSTEGDMALGNAVLGKREAKEMVRQMSVKASAQQRLMASATPGAPLSADGIIPRPVDQTYVGRDRFDTITANPVKLVSEEPVSTFSIDVDTAAYAFVRRALNNGYLPQANAVRIEELINYFDYDYPLPKDRATPFKPTIAVFPTPWNPDTKLLHVGIKGYDITPKEKPKTNLVFLIDVSGSMTSEDKLPLLKNSMRMLVNSLEADDTVAIVVYAGAAGTVLEPTRVAEKGKILAALEKLQAGGSTAGGEGVRMAYSLAEANFDPDGVNRVFLATDGDFNVGIRDPEVLKNFVERKRNTGVYLSVLGFGQGNYNDALMQKLAQNGNGNAAYIDTLNEARKVLVDEASGTMFTIANDVKLQVEFNPAMVAEYRLIGYESRLLNREDFKNDKVDAGDIGSGHTVTAIYEITPADSKARLIDDLRYDSQKKSSAKKSEKNAEVAFLKIRYKLPGESESREISTPITAKNEYEKIVDTPAESRFASAVAAFGQLLRNDSHIRDFTYNDVIELARKAKGEDTFGYRAEFVNLARLANTSAAMGNR